MATVIDRIELTQGGWRDRHGALRLAVRAARDCLHETGRTPHDATYWSMRESIGIGTSASRLWRQ
jgi:hypothetical protein